MRFRLSVGVLGLLATQVGSAQFQEFRVNTYTVGAQGTPSTAMDSDGNFVVVWTSESQDGSGTGIFAQRYDVEGAPLGSEFQVNTDTTGSQGSSAVAMNASGQFVIAWQGPGDGSLSGIFARRFDTDGSPLGNEFQVNTYTTGAQSGADVGIDDQGNFVVVWQSGAATDDPRIAGRRFDASGVPLGGFQANDSTLIGSIQPAVAMNGSGNFVVSWSDADNYYGYPIHVRFRPYDSSGAPLCFSRVVTGASVRGQDVTILPSGDFLVTWSEFDDVWVRRFHGCSAVSFGKRVNADTQDGQTSPTVAADTAGNYVVTWQSPQDGSGAGVAAQRFDGDDNPVGDEYQVNVFSTNDQRSPAAAMNGSGSLVVAWSSDGQDGSSHGVYARGPDVISGTGLSVDLHAADNTSSNLNGLLEAGETVRVEPAFRNSRSSDLDLTGTASALTGPPGPVYGIDDDSADYGTIPGGGSAGCASATGDCFEVSVAGSRPAPHWDVLLEETLNAGDAQTWRLHVGASFLDVPVSHMFYWHVENLFHNGVTAGCSAVSYCPDEPVRRDQMAVFLLTARHGGSYSPPRCTRVFADVPCPGPFTDWVEQLWREGITGGCGAGNYCPASLVTRAQMAALLLKAKHGSDYEPPPCEGAFVDVPCSNLFASWIEQLSRESITAGCGGQNYCPDRSVSRGQMAVFLVKAFGLKLYGP